MSGLEQAQRYLREKGITVGIEVDAVTSRGLSHRATYLGLLVTEYDVVAILRRANDEELLQVHYSRLLVRAIP
jgi:hypothetical protein